MMKNNNKKKGNTAKKLLPAAMMLAVSASMLGTSTYAWFTMNKEVEVTGLTMKTKVSSNLLISSNNEAGSYKADQLIEGRQALLEPVSSVSGKTGSFYYTLDAAENGSKAHAASGDNVFKLYSEATNTNATAGAAGKYYYDNQFNGEYGIEPSADSFGTAYGYIDYVFYMKATGNAANQKLIMTACDLNYTYPNAGEPAVATDPGDNAWRIAVFASDITANGGIGNSGSGASVGQLDPAASDAKVILKTNDSQGYFTADTAALKTDATGKVNITSAVGASTSAEAANYGQAVLDPDIDAGVTKYYKVLVRVWLEGEDKSCYSETYAKLTEGWTLDTEFKLVDENANDVMENNVVTEKKTPVTFITKNGFNPSIVPTQNADTDPIDVVIPND